MVHLRTGERTAGGAASVSYGSLDTARLTAMTSVPGTVAGTPVDALAVAELFGTAGDFTWFSDNGTEYNRLDDSLRTRENNDKRQLNSHVRLRLGEPGARLSLLQSFLSRDEGLPGHGANPTDDVRLRTQRSLTALSGDRSAGLWRIEGRGGCRPRRRLRRPRGELGVGVQRTASRLLGAWDTCATRCSRVLGGLTLGVQQDRFETTNLLDGRHSAAAQRWALTPGAYATSACGASTPYPQWPGARTHNRSFGRRPPDAAVSPALSADLFAHAPRARCGPGRHRPQGQRQPVGPGAGLHGALRRSGALVGNPDLRPERGVQWDVGARVCRTTRPWARPRGGALLERRGDLIVMVQNAQRTSVPISLDKAWIQGVEAAATLDLGWLRAQSNLTTRR